MRLRSIAMAAGTGGETKEYLCARRWEHAGFLFFAAVRVRVFRRVVTQLHSVKSTVFEITHKLNLTKIQLMIFPLTDLVLTTKLNHSISHILSIKIFSLMKFIKLYEITTNYNFVEAKT